MFKQAARCAISAPLLLAALWWGGTALADAPDVRKLMTPEEFQAAGLGKLGAEEIEALNRWVVRYTAKEAPVMRQSSEEVREEIKKVDSEAIRTRVVGDFRGWTGSTVFRLENGQTWKQRIGGSWFHRATNPEVELKKNFMGYWEMRVIAADRAVGVTPVR